MVVACISIVTLPAVCMERCPLLGDQLEELQEDVAVHASSAYLHADGRICPEERGFVFKSPFDEWQLVNEKLNIQGRFRLGATCIEARRRFLDLKRQDPANYSGPRFSVLRQVHHDGQKSVALVYDRIGEKNLALKSIPAQSDATTVA